MGGLFLRDVMSYALRYGTRRYETVRYETILITRGLYSFLLPLMIEASGLTGLGYKPIEERGESLGRRTRC